MKLNIPLPDRRPENLRPGFRYDFLAAAIILGICLLNGCSKETVEVSSPSYNYFPVEKGRYVIFDVDSIVHGTNDNDNDDSVYYFHYQVKEVIDTPFIDGEGQTRQVVVRYFREDSTQEWNVNIVWSQLLTSSNAYRWEDNIAYHKLSFPINTQIEWNGNDKNTMDEELYRYQDIHESKTFQSLQFDSTLTVIQRDDDNFVEKIYGEEVYASGIGLVYKVRNNLRKTNNSVVSGTEFTMVVNSFGKE